ncbi:LytR/AlgR family response regulator transcription factor [Motilimonas cestriensis]|uniref:LytR/AlgR family response regulator transcription factor n=1 Tax=Motilimonas cestriensis TaxID=2742685 RepID=UPI001E5B4B11|nr:LytTR family DNA-binding domain-containing protein [Motilimonas cestriensis]
MHNNITALIVDDEPLLRIYLDKLLGDNWPELSIIGSAGDGNKALEMVEELNPDIIFLDIRMPGLDGIEVARRLSHQPNSPLIVFTTAYDQYAVEAFEHEAVDYLLKPISEDRLVRSIEKVKLRLQSKQSDPEPEKENLNKLIAKLSNPNGNYLEWLKASRKDNIHIIAIADVLCFHAEDKYTTAITHEGEFVIRTPIKDLAQQLDPQNFWQVHRSSIVNVSAIKHVNKDITGKMVVHLNNVKRPVAVSRSFQTLFKQM